MNNCIFGKRKQRRFQGEEPAHGENRQRGLFFYCGFFAMLCDCLGIGSFALLSTFYRNSKIIDDRVVPGTMVMGNELPVAIEALCFITCVKLDTQTLVAMIVACAVGRLESAYDVY